MFSFRCSLSYKVFSAVWAIPSTQYIKILEIKLGKGLRRSFAMPNPFVLNNKICLNQIKLVNLKKDEQKYS